MLIKDRAGILLGTNVADYIQADPADDFDAAIGQIAMCDQGRFHAAPSWAKTPHPDAQLNRPFGRAEMRIKMSNPLYARWQRRIMSGYVWYQTQRCLWRASL